MTITIPQELKIQKNFLIECLDAI
jgi:hypothetical protein